MKAAVYKGKDTLKVEEIPVPVAGPGEAIIKVAFCGICGSDVRLFSEGFFPVGLIIGHEFCGTVYEIGIGEEGWAIGDRVTVMPALSCGKCSFCLSGARHHCMDLKLLGMNEGMHGGFAEYVKVDTRMLRGLPDEVTDEEAANVEPCAVSLRAVNRSGIRIGDSVAIFGTGSIGLFTLQLSRLAGASSIYAIEPAASRAQVADILGADLIVDPENTNVVQELTNLTEKGVDVAFVCSAAPPVLQQAVDAVKHGGKVVIIGGGLSAEVIPEYWMWKEVEIKGSFAYIDEFELALELFRKGEVKVEGMISDVIGLEELQQAMVKLAQPTSEIKVLVRPNLESA